MKRRIFSFLLIGCIVLGLLVAGSLMAFAEDPPGGEPSSEPHQHEFGGDGFCTGDGCFYKKYSEEEILIPLDYYLENSTPVLGADAPEYIELTGDYRLEGDIYTTSPIKATGNGSLDLNGYEIILDVEYSSEDDASFLVTSGQAGDYTGFTISDSKGGGRIYMPRENNPIQHLLIDGGILNLKGGTIEGYARAISIYNEGDFNMHGGEVRAYGLSAIEVGSNYYPAAFNMYGGRVVNGSGYMAFDESWYQYISAILLEGSGAMAHLYGGEVEQQGDAYGTIGRTGICVYDGAFLNIEKAKIKSIYSGIYVDYSNLVIGVMPETDFDIDNPYNVGKIENNAAVVIDGGTNAIHGNNANLVITGGTYNCGGGDGSYIAAPGIAALFADYCNTMIIDGEFNGCDGSFVFDPYYNVPLGNGTLFYDGSTAIMGGSFSAPTPGTYAIWNYGELGLMDTAAPLAIDGVLFTDNDEAYIIGFLTQTTGEIKIEGKPNGYHPLIKGNMEGVTFVVDGFLADNYEVKSVEGDMGFDYYFAEKVCAADHSELIYNNDEAMHWQEPKEGDCGCKIGKEPHYFDNGVCLACEYSIYEATHADGHTVADNICTDEVCLAHNHNGMDFLPWTSIDTLPTTAGSYYLVNDVALDDEATISANINLCLNGRIIQGGSESIAILEGGSLSIYDCQDDIVRYLDTETDFDTKTKRYSYRGGTNAETGFAVAGGLITGFNYSAIIVEEGATLTLNGGSIAGNNGDFAIGAEGNLVMNGGKITANYGRYAVVYVVNQANLTINGGEISNNTAAMCGVVSHGGFITDSGGGETTVVMDGGTAANNTSYMGTAFYVDTFKMSGGEISGNKGAYGTVVASNVEMIGGEISDNENTENCGTVIAVETLKITGGEICENIGGGVGFIDPVTYMSEEYVPDYTPATEIIITGSANITDNEAAQIGGALNVIITTLTGDETPTIIQTDSDDETLSGSFGISLRNGVAEMEAVSSSRIGLLSDKITLDDAQNYALTSTNEALYIKRLTKVDIYKGKELIKNIKVPYGSSLDAVKAKLSGYTVERVALSDGGETVGEDWTVPVYNVNLYLTIKKNPEYTIPTGLTATAGQTLDDVALPAGFTWDDPTVSVGAAGSNIFLATYTPEDTVNYNIIENIEIAVAVNVAPTPLENLVIELENAPSNPTITVTSFDGVAYTAVANGDKYTAAVPNGMYNIVGTATIGGEEVTITSACIVSGDTTETLTVPTGKISSELVVGDGLNANEVSVKGLDVLAYNRESENTLTEVKYSLKVSREEDSGTTEQNAIKAQVEADSLGTLEFLDISLLRQQEGESEPTLIGSDNNELLHIILPFDSTGKTGILVLRYHDGGVQKLTQAANGDGERFALNTGYITIFAKKFSDYAIAYNTSSEMPLGSSGGTSMKNVTFNSNGGTSISPKNIALGKTVAEPTAPTKEGFTFDGWYIDKELTTKYDFSEKVTKSFTLYAKWVENKTEASDEKKNPFIDVNESDWFHDMVNKAFEQGLINGVTPETFEPNSNITRAMFVTVLYRVEKEPEAKKSTFVDLEDGFYYLDAVAWASENGIVKGISETEFAPNDNITREQMAAILFRFAQYKGVDAMTLAEHLGQFSDSGSASEYAVSALNWAVGTGIINGKLNGVLDPLGNATRAEATAMLVRLIERNIR